MQTIIVEIKDSKKKKIVLALLNELDIPYKLIPELKPKQQKILDGVIPILRENEPNSKKFREASKQLEKF